MDSIRTTENSETALIITVTCWRHIKEHDTDLKLTGKIALVTGSTAGIGFAIAKSLAIEGAYVYVNGRTQKRVDAAMAAIQSYAAKSRVDGIAADFSDPAGAQAVIAKLPAVDVLVNNVGIFEPSHLRRFLTRTGTVCLRSM
jgi:NAD(P)-dependent dehydrogenase (short-subunit alcohol dehydrogenase family)